MSIFQKYARYYDLLYSDKNYDAESRYVRHLLQAHADDAKSLFEMGSGTGKHALFLARSGYRVLGVDRSREMCEQANEMLLSQDADIASGLTFQTGDIRAIRLGTTFDAVISLFHVISYQTADEDLKAALSTARAHLMTNGVFLFDCWYGPAVLTDRPAIRIKRLENDEIIVTRIAEPVLHPNDNMVDVRYHAFIRDKKTDKTEELMETHRMRYLFLPEIRALLKDSGFELVFSGEWMTDRELGSHTWSSCFIGKAL